MVTVVDGDTMDVRIRDRIDKVRYIGMNAPELHHPTKSLEPLAREAAEANRRLVERRAGVSALWGRLPLIAVPSAPVNGRPSRATQGRP